jgi:hypothetical protein
MTTQAMTESMQELGARLKTAWNSMKAREIHDAMEALLSRLDAPRPTFEQWWNHNGHGWEHGRAEYTLAKLAYGERVDAPQKADVAREPHDGWMNAWLYANCVRDQNFAYLWNDAVRKLAGDWADFRMRVDAQPEDGDGSRVLAAALRRMCNVLSMLKLYPEQTVEVFPILLDLARKLEVGTESADPQTKGESDANQEGK